MKLEVAVQNPCVSRCLKQQQNQWKQPKRHFVLITSISAALINIKHQTYHFHLGLNCFRHPVQCPDNLDPNAAPQARMEQGSSDHHSAGAGAEVVEHPPVIAVIIRKRRRGENRGPEISRPQAMDSPRETEENRSAVVNSLVNNPGVIVDLDAIDADDDLVFTSPAAARAILHGELQHPHEGNEADLLKDSRKGMRRSTVQRHKEGRMSQLK